MPRLHNPTGLLRSFRFNCAVVAVMCQLLIACDSTPKLDYRGPTSEWLVTGSTAAGQRFSPLTQINSQNVHRLQKVWEYRLGETSRGGNSMSSLQVTPIVVGNAMYLCSPFMSSLGIPCNAPPWGELMAIDLGSGDFLWRRPFGTLNGQLPLLGKYIEIGMPSFGGSIQTASGLAFIGAAPDRFIRAIDVNSGEELWRDELPFSAHSVPVTYRTRADGKQFVAIAAGGHLLAGSPLGDAIVAYTLKD